MVLLLAGCAGVTPTPSPMADVPPEPQPQLLSCGLAAGDGIAFRLECAEPTATPKPTAEPTATATPNPAENQFLCNTDTRCVFGQFRVYWDRNLTMLRCALPQGAKVTVITRATSQRMPDEGEPLLWVVTGADAGGVPCEGWVPATFVQEIQ